MDSKGRITIPAELRRKLGLENGDIVWFELKASKKVKRQVETPMEAIEFVDSLESVRSFRYSEGEVEVFLDV